MDFFKLTNLDQLNRVAYLANNMTSQELLELFYGQKKDLNPLVFKHTSGKKWTDMLTSTQVILPFFSDRLIRVLEENKFTGWEKYEIIIENKPIDITTRYYAIYITGRCENNIKSISKDLKLNNWDGADFFTMPETSKIWITEKVKKCLNNQKPKITNV